MFFFYFKNSYINKWKHTKERLIIFMKKVAIINACTDLGLHVNGASQGSLMLTKDLKSENIAHTYTIQNEEHKEEVNIRTTKTSKKKYR